MRKEITNHKETTGGPLLIGYLPALYPDPAAYGNILQISANSGLRFMEIGIPCMDPYLDGDIIQKALKKVAVSTKYIPQLIADSAAAVHKANLGSIAMIYNETLDEIGIKMFADVCTRANIDAVLIPNISDDNRRLLFRTFEYSDVEIVSFIGYDTSEKDIEQIMKYTTGFVYLQSTKGSTGGQFVASKEAKKRLEGVKHIASSYQLAVALGFGISTYEDVQQAVSIGADVVIIGTALVKAADNDTAAYRSYLEGLKPFLNRRIHAVSDFR
jgi:tryptophan synthase alpha chain